MERAERRNGERKGKRQLGNSAPSAGTWSQFLTAELLLDGQREAKEHKDTERAVSLETRLGFLQFSNVTTWLGTRRSG